MSPPVVVYRSIFGSRLPYAVPGWLLDEAPGHDVIRGANADIGLSHYAEFSVAGPALAGVTISGARMAWLRSRMTTDRRLSTSLNQSHAGTHMPFRSRACRFHLGLGLGVAHSFSARRLISSSALTRGIAAGRERTELIAWHTNRVVWLHRHQLLWDRVFCRRVCRHGTRRSRARCGRLTSAGMGHTPPLVLRVVRYATSARLSR